MSTPDQRRADPSEPEGLLPDDSVLTFEDYMAMQKAIGEPKRFRILYALTELGELSASELAEAVDLEQNTLHHHLKTKERGGEGLYSYYEASALGRAILEDGVRDLMRREWDHLETYSG
jgi:ArsR family transcriptional regulator